MIGSWIEEFFAFVFYFLVWCKLLWRNGEEEIFIVFRNMVFVDGFFFFYYNFNVEKKNKVKKVEKSYVLRGWGGKIFI